MLNVGMLWYDADSKTALEAKVLRAVEYYCDKYGQQPNVCYTHPSMLSPDGAPKLIGGVRVKASRTVIKDHFYLGVSDER